MAVAAFDARVHLGDEIALECVDERRNVERIVEALVVGHVGHELPPLAQSTIELSRSPRANICQNGNS